MQLAISFRLPTSAAMQCDDDDDDDDEGWVTCRMIEKASRLLDTLGLLDNLRLLDNLGLLDKLRILDKRYQNK